MWQNKRSCVWWIMQTRKSAICTIVRFETCACLSCELSQTYASKWYLFFFNLVNLEIIRVFWRMLHKVYHQRLGVAGEQVAIKIQCDIISSWHLWIDCLFDSKSPHFFMLLIVSNTNLDHMDFGIKHLKSFLNMKLWKTKTQMIF